jgi:putative acetyltransferase
MNFGTAGEDPIDIRRARLEDLSDMRDLFADTVSAVCAKDYTQKQRSAWISQGRENTHWQEKLGSQFVLIALLNNIIVGFASLQGGDYVDLMYVHKSFQRLGVAGKLYHALEQEAQRLEKELIRSDVSITARSFFEKMGFGVIREETITIHDTPFLRYRMEKSMRS